jgi:hypothetical protein
MLLDNAYVSVSTKLLTTKSSQTLLIVLIANHSLECLVALLPLAFLAVLHVTRLALPVLKLVPKLPKAYVDALKVSALIALPASR